ncbi:MULTISPECIES: hypothetical protein [Kitasatospora]|uniref:Uncharacterized protein n=1 Tax=Kitasatospora setae (strain ATCC 33774 / DSM 43861 / JCM 3304 / KCC A-0304 / NBRC 14216 / KM-6054) TaxID=452652 RepID=E4NDB0_KITSK|nr:MULTISPECIES: hypothetical protein [Kitasatospora]BAJ29191.1 hypothetical protein KSE_33830 [Kitasatospora setae KM-6054]
MPTTDEPGPGSSGPGRDDDPFEGLVLDDEFVRSATNKEASGRARMLTERWKKDPPPENEPWRPATVVRLDDRRSRWHRRRQRRSIRPRRPFRPGLGSALALLLVPVLVLVGLASLGDGSTLPQKSSALPALGAETAPPSSAPPTLAPEVPTPERPWAGAPAESWPNGADGIGMPTETPATGAFGARQVAANLEAVKAYLVASNLDPEVLSGSTARPALDLLDEQSAADLSKALEHPTTEDDPASWLSRFDPAWAVPVTDQVKVQGSVTFEGDGENGMLVHTDVTYVYALRPGPDAGKTAAGGAKPASWAQADHSREVAREIVRRSQDFRFYDPERFKVTPGKPVLGEGSSEFGNNRCEMGSGFLEPEFDFMRAPAAGPTPSGPESDPYDRTKPLRTDGECGRISRT